MTVAFANGAGAHVCTVERVALRLFSAGIAILTVETSWAPGGAGDALTLADAQTIIDHFRRLYTPFWDKGAPQRVPLDITFTDGRPYAQQDRSEMAKALAARRKTLGFADPPLLEPWQSWCADLPNDDWRIPSDERTPAMSYIALEEVGSPRATLDSIRPGDWYRLAEADQSGGGAYEYNPDFLATKRDGMFYDRFAPHAHLPDYIATRQVFGGAHYAMVTVDGTFARDVLETHFARHYEKLALISRFEETALLGFSARLTRLVAAMPTNPTDSDIKRFHAGLHDIRQAFLVFVHNHRFTGVSSQIQPGEMYAKWRASLDLDELFRDVEAEINSASDFALAQSADEQAREANRLASAATVFAVVIAPAAIMPLSWAMTVMGWLHCTLGATSDGAKAAISFGVYVLLALLCWMCISSTVQRLRRRVRAPSKSGKTANQPQKTDNRL